MKNNWQQIVSILFVGIIVGVGGSQILPKLNSIPFPKLKNASTASITKTSEPEVVEEYEWGIRVDTFNVLHSEILPNQFVSEILANFKVDNQTVHNLAINSADIFDFKNFRAGNDYTIITEKNATDTVAKYMIYEKDPIEYVVYNLQNPKDITIGKRPTKTVEKSIQGKIDGSLWNTLIESGGSGDLAVKLAQVYQWTIDFTRLNAGDEFNVVFDEIYVDGEFYKTDNIKASLFKRGEKETYAFWFDQGEGKQAGYYDENGMSLKRAFLKAPVKYSRISSRYSGRRFHPVQKRYKAHLGTDYAAAYNTPIVATANGTVIASSYTSGNGNYVKIKHNSTYTTQYLHMNKRAVRNGQKVSQGDVIGYVGSTGLATGPHVCYRFWKNGRQVDPYAQDLPIGDPIEKDLMDEFEAEKAHLLDLLNNPNQQLQPIEQDDFGFRTASFINYGQEETFEN